MNTFLTQWHRAVFERDRQVLNDLLADDVSFYSPFGWKPKEGKLMTATVLNTVIQVFEDFTYHRQLQQDSDYILEFSAKVKGLHVKGVDLIHLNEAGKIDQFEVMIRPANGLAALGEEMGKRLGAMG